MSVTPTPRLEERIQHWIKTGRFRDADAGVESALEALEAQELERFVELRELVLAGYESPSAGS